MHITSQCGHDSFIALSNQTDIEGLHQSLCQAIERHFPSHVPTIFRCNTPGSHHFSRIYAAEASSTPKQMELEFVDQLTPLVLEVPSPAMVIPLTHAHQIIGALHIDKLQLTSPRRASLLLTLGQVYAGHLQLLTHCSHDGLTGLYNRQYLNQYLSRICNRLANYPTLDRRSNEPLASFFALFDIDHFKHVNDTYGHTGGDEVLLELAQLMEKSFRDHDHLFRYGGEEFALVLSGVTQPVAQKVLDRFRGKVAAHQFNPAGNVTISIGYTEIQKEMSPLAIIQLADKALYQAKANGRNRIDLIT